MAKGQITIPKDIRKILGVTSSDRISFIVEGNTVRIVNSAVYAMQVLQNEMSGEAARAGINSHNVLISAALNARGVLFQAYIKAASHPNNGLICEQNVDERKRIFHKKFPNRLTALDKFLSIALLTLELIPIPIEDIITGDKDLIAKFLFIGYT